MHRPAAIVTAGIAAGAVALAVFVGAGAGPDEPVEAAPPPSMDASHLQSGLTDASMAGADGMFDVVRSSVESQQVDLDAVRAEREQDGAKALEDSFDGLGDSMDAIRAESDEIAAERAEAEAEAERIAEEEAEAERIAEEEAAEREEAEQAAARSNDRDEAPAPEAEDEAEPAPAEPAPAGGSPKETARGMLGSYGWGDDQWGCLESLWERESNWNHTAMNPSSGAYGIPQSLPGNKMATAGADWQTNPTTQITWGLGYIQERYGSPCSAWAHSESVGWY